MNMRKNTAMEKSGTSTAEKGKRKYVAGVEVRVR